MQPGNSLSIKLHLLFMLMLLASLMLKLFAYLWGSSREGQKGSVEKGAWLGFIEP